MHEFSTFIVRHWLLASAFLVVLIWLIVEEVRTKASSVHGISVQDATTLINREQAIVVDVRPAEIYNTGHIVNAISIPAPDFDAQFNKITKNKKKPIIIVCATGQSANAFASKLKKQGIERVYSLSGGVQGWKNANLPLTKT